MWTVENRARYGRSQLRYPSDLTDEEWTLAKPHIPRAKCPSDDSASHLSRLSVVELAA
jgi:transposase